MVSLRLDSYPKTKTATFAQARIDGATSGGQANKVSNHKDGVEAKASCFNLKKNKSWPIIFIALSTKNGRCIIDHRPSTNLVQMNVPWHASFAKEQGGIC